MKHRMALKQGQRITPQSVKSQEFGDMMFNYSAF